MVPPYLSRIWSGSLPTRWIPCFAGEKMAMQTLGKPAGFCSFWHFIGTGRLFAPEAWRFAMWSASLLLLAGWLRKACGRLAQTVFILAGRLTLTVERVNDHEVSEAHGSLSIFQCVLAFRSWRKNFPSWTTFSVERVNYHEVSEAHGSLNLWKQCVLAFRSWRRKNFPSWTTFSVKRVNYHEVSEAHGSLIESSVLKQRKALKFWWAFLLD